MPARFEVEVAGLRSAHGAIRACLTTTADHFPKCQQDEAAHRLIVPASAPVLRFENLPSGDYALALIHDENANRKLDTIAGVPREGVGFSRNPRLMFGPPRFSAARVTIDHATIGEPVKVKYFF